MVWSIRVDIENTEYRAKSCKVLLPPRNVDINGLIIGDASLSFGKVVLGEGKFQELHKVLALTRAFVEEADDFGHGHFHPKTMSDLKYCFNVVTSLVTGQQSCLAV